MFGDRLATPEDRDWLQDLQEHLLLSKFGWKSAPAADSTNILGSTTTNALPSLTFGDGLVSESLFDGEEQVLFGDFMKMGVSRDERVYEQLPSIAKLAQIMERYLEEYNATRGSSRSAAMAAATAAAAGARSAAQPGGGSSATAAAAAGGGGGSQMELVLFKDAVLHVVKLARILRQPR